jgi:hypothetical protein
MARYRPGPSRGDNEAESDRRHPLTEQQRAPVPACAGSTKQWASVAAANPTREASPQVPRDDALGGNARAYRADQRFGQLICCLKPISTRWQRAGRSPQAGREGCVQNRGDAYAESPRRPGSAAYAAYAAAPGIGRIRKRVPPHGRPDRDDSYVVAMGGVRADLVACERPQQSEEDGKAGAGRRALQLRLAS